MIEPARGPFAFLLTIDNLWNYGISNILVNLAFYVGISGGQD